MILIIQNANLPEKIISDNIFYLNNICHLKKLENNPEILILNNITLDEYGIIKDYDFFLEEVIITKPIKIIIANFYHDKLKEICDYHHIFLINI